MANLKDASLEEIDIFIRDWILGFMADGESHHEDEILAGCERALSDAGLDISRYENMLARGPMK
jgi:hypothetical protein